MQKLQNQVLPRAERRETFGIRSRKNFFNAEVMVEPIAEVPGFPKLVSNRKSTCWGRLLIKELDNTVSEIRENRFFNCNNVGRSLAQLQSSNKICFSLQTSLSE